MTHPTRYAFVAMLLIVGLILSACGGSSNVPASTSRLAPASNSNTQPASSGLPSPRSISEDGPWTCKSATADAGTMKNFNAEWPGHGRAQWMVQAGCANPTQWPNDADWQSASQRKMGTTFEAPIMEWGPDLNPSFDQAFYIVGSNGHAAKIPLDCPTDQQTTIDVYGGEFGESVTFCKNDADTKVTFKQAAFIGSLALTPIPGARLVAVVTIAGVIVGGLVAGLVADAAYNSIVEAMARHSNDNDNPNFTNSQARVLIAGIAALLTAHAANGGPDQWCSEFKLGDKVLSVAIWIADKVGSNDGFVAVYNPSNTQAPWVTAYRITREKMMGKQGWKDDGTGKHYDKDTPCPPPGQMPPLQAAHY